MKVVKDLLSEQIYKILKNDIINSKINFGEVLVNKNLQERFEVSSTPIRDAILRLKEDGIIEAIENGKLIRLKTEAKNPAEAFEMPACMAIVGNHVRQV